MEVSLMIVFVAITFYYTLRYSIFSLMTNVESIKVICLDSMITVCLFEFFDMTQGFLQGHIKALG